MEKTGSIDKLYTVLLRSAERIELGRKALLTSGQEAYGRIAYVGGLEGALNTFKEIQVASEPAIIITAEKIYLQQDLRFCDPTDKLTIKSLERSLIYLDDALRSIAVVKSAMAYQNAEATHPTEYREKRGDVPKDVVHNACNINAARLDQNNRIPGLPMLEKDLVQQRKANLSTAKESYIELQQKALGIEPAKTKSKDREIGQ